MRLVPVATSNAAGQDVEMAESVTQRGSGDDGVCSRGGEMGKGREASLRCTCPSAESSLSGSKKT